ncbi:MAG TPA: SCO family protein, partial [Pyrinomonadaceae bacterium]|nr:SCO family protein [Pyrinomonadaceae bacterium]
MLLTRLTFALLACTLAFIPVQAQHESAAAHASKTPAKKTRQTRQQTYSCPMHPTVKAKKPGRCPKCGMDLRVVKNDEPVAAQVSAASHDADLSKMTIPDVELLDQNGRKIHFYTDLVKGRTVAINFIFTTCTTICPPLGATFARVQKELGDKVGRDVHFISISVDPATDTPERLKAWGAKFHAGDGWTFVTGNKPQIDELLRALAASSARREDHTPTVLIGNDTQGTWTRTYGLAKASQLVQVINDAMAGKTATAAASEEISAAQKYFTDVELLNQNGEKVRFYSDVLKGKTVIVNAFFTTCTSVCPPMNRNMEKIQEVLGDRVGRDLFLVSITVDPEVDTPARLKDYAQKFHAGPGWVFLTGKKENLDSALYKLGQYVENKDAHKTIFIIGNEPTGLWKKAFGMANVAELLQVVE